MRKQILITGLFAFCLILFLSANIWLERFLVKPFANQTQLEKLLNHKDIKQGDFSSISKQQRTLIHISQSFCICNAYSSTHKQTLNDLADNQEMQILNVELAEFESFKSDQNAKAWNTLMNLVPSTPATILLNSKGKIEYIGPYSSGLTCNSSNSFIERFLTQEEGDSPIANWVNNGCYCTTEDK